MVFKKKKIMTPQEVKRYNFSVRLGIEVYKEKIPIKNFIIGGILIGSSFIILDFGLGMFFGICIMSTPRIKQGFKDGYYLACSNMKKLSKTIKNKFGEYKQDGKE